MDGLRFEITHQRRVRRVTVRSLSVIIGRSTDCNLNLPIPWVADRLLIVQADPPFARAKALDSSTYAMADGKIMGSDWISIEPRTVFQLRGPGGDLLFIRVLHSLSQLPPTVAKEIVAPPSRDDDLAMVFATEAETENSVREAERELKGSTPAPAAQALSAPLPSTRSKVVKQAFVCVVVAVIVLICGTLAVRANRTRRNESIFAADRDSTQASIARSRQLIADSRFVDAKSELAAARPVALKWPDLSDELQEIDTLTATPAIQYGGAGLKLIHGKWITADRAQACRDAEQKNEPAIRSLQERAGALCNRGKWQEARLAVAEALSIMDAEPAEIKPHPDRPTAQAQLQKIDDAVNRERLAAESDRQAQAAAAAQRQAATESVNPTNQPPSSAIQKITPVMIAPRQGTAGANSAEQTAYLQCQRIIKADLSSSANPSFSDYASNPWKVMKYRDGYVVRLRVQWQSDSGKTIHSVFICKVRPVSNAPWEGRIVRRLSDE